MIPDARQEMMSAMETVDELFPIITASAAGGRMT
jgi:hypothetical protein